MSAKVEIGQYYLTKVRILCGESFATTVQLVVVTGRDATGLYRVELLDTMSSSQVHLTRPASALRQATRTKAETGGCSDAWRIEQHRARVDARRESTS